MSDQGRPKFETLIIMSVYPSQRKKIGISRIGIKKLLVEKHGVTDDKRTATRIRDTIKRMCEENILDPITAHSFHLTPQGLEKALGTKSSETWKHYSDRLAGKPVSTKKTKKTVTKPTATKSKKSPKAKSGAGAKPGTPKTPMTPKGKAKGRKSTSTPTTTKKKTKVVQAKKVHYDAVIEKTPSAAIKAKSERDERAKRMAARREAALEKREVARNVEAVNKKTAPGKKKEEQTKESAPAPAQKAAVPQTTSSQPQASNQQTVVSTSISAPASSKKRRAGK